MPELIYTIENFKGLDEHLSGRDHDEGKKRYTRSAQNVMALHGELLGRNGFDNLFGITTQLADAINGVVHYRQQDGTSFLLAITQTKVYKLEVSGVATDITGTALAGAATSIVSSTTIDNTLVFTNGVNLRKWTGSGNTAVLASAGDPDYPSSARLVTNFEDFLMLGDVTIAAVGYPATIRYSEDWDASWDVADEIVLVETPGALKAWDKIGRVLYCYKDDGIVAVRFIGGAPVFSQHQVPFSLGILAPMSLVSIPQLGHIFLATDFNLYLNANGSVNKLPTNLRDTLHQVMAPGWAYYAAAVAVPEDDLYKLYFSSGGALNDRCLIFNYRSGEWALDTFPNHGIGRVCVARLTADSDIWTGDAQIWSADSTTWLDNVTSSSHSVIAGLEDRRVYRMDAPAHFLDDSAPLPMCFYRTDWQELGYHGGKYLNKIDVICERDNFNQLAVSAARDHHEVFTQRQQRPMNGSGSLTEIDTVVEFTFSPILGQRFDIKLEFIPNGTLSRAQPIVKEIWFYYTPVNAQGQPRPGRSH